MRNEGDSNDPKRQKTEQDDAERPVEFDEDDIAYQLAAMGESYGLDPGEYGNSGEQGEWEEGAEGLPFTEEDAVALFEDMLDDRNVSPYTPWEKLIEPRSAILSDDRYTALSSTHARKKAWVDWSRKRLQRLKELRDRQEKLDPRIPYLSFLRQYATPKLYWPEFKRKYKKESVMKDTKLSDKDREKLYREHINRLKLPHSTLESDLLQLLRSIGPAGLNSSTNLSSLPSQLLTDLRYISLPTHTSDAIISDFIEKLAPAPEGITGHAETDEDSAKKVADRKRRAEALRDRERRVQEEKVRTEKEIKAGKWQLREREKELERANTSGKEGIRGMLNEMGGQGPT